MKHKALKITGLVFLVIVIIVAAFLVFLSTRPAVPKDYTNKVKTGGDIEAKYLAGGAHDVAYIENGAMQNFKKYEIYYPRDIADMPGKLPAVVMCNGTGVAASKASALMEHLASWGFVVIGTEEEYSWNGFGAEMCTSLLEKLNSTRDVEGYDPNPFYQKIDMQNIGLSGHSQGGVGVINAATVQPHASAYKAIFAASPTNTQLADALDWHYDADKLATNIFMVSSTGKGDENLVVNLQGLQKIYDSVPATLTRVMARRTDADHGDMLYFADGYATAWFMWQLAGDAEAARAFVGADGEIANNELYGDVRVAK